MNANLQRFTGFAGTYDQYRPALPLVIREILAQLAGNAPPLRVIDLGAGTGLSTRLWKGFDAAVIGIEPSADMRGAFAQAQALDPGLSNLQCQEGTSTKTGLPDACADIVTVSQALHWMEPEPTVCRGCACPTPGWRVRRDRLRLATHGSSRARRGVRSVHGQGRSRGKGT